MKIEIQTVEITCALQFVEVGHWQRLGDRRQTTQTSTERSWQMGPQRSTGCSLSGCLSDRQARPPWFPVINVVSDESEYAQSTSLLRLISRGRQRVILHG